ncbi:MAG: galactokinase [Phaeodactylibacter sp.]|nr:galactokinase [Phaeodactylibacter sp.]MCB9288700.1 galactokinase [Lewinellaceae bacterium]
MHNLSDIVSLYEERFDTHPLLVRACGRINIIGEHTDYNNGFVLPAAVNKHIYFAIGENGTAESHLFAADIGESYSFNIHEIEPCDKLWANYLMGIMQQLQERGVTLEGVDCVFGGNLPIGSGLSSSAALECGFALGLDTLFCLDVGRVELAQLAQRSSHKFVGIPCGIMDQFASLLGREGQAIKLDCRSLEYEYIPLDLGDCELALINTKVHHELASSEYPVRVRECREGVAVIQKHHSGVESLRDITLDMLEAHRSELSEVIYRRCAYVIRENARLEEAAVCLAEGNMERLGELLLLTHEGLRDEYGVSCPELDFLVDFARGFPGVLGARLMGGGFGGCTINLIRLEAREKFLKDITKAYYRQFGIHPEYYFIRPVDGTKVVREEE